MRPLSSTRSRLTPRRAARLAAACGLVAACAGSPGASDSMPGAIAQADSGAIVTDPGSPNGRDLSEVDVCALVPGDAVASALGGKLERASGSTYGGSGLVSDCTYMVRVGRRTAVALVFLYPPHHFEAMREVEEVLEPVSDVGDEAYWTKTGSMHQLTVLKRGIVTLDARAETQRDARRLAELALSRF